MAFAGFVGDIGPNTYKTKRRREEKSNVKKKREYK
jgi:hypothetical protein